MEFPLVLTFVEGDSPWMKTDVLIDQHYLTLMITNMWCDAEPMSYVSCVNAFLDEIIPQCGRQGGILRTPCGYWTLSPKYVKVDYKGSDGESEGAANGITVNDGVAPSSRDDHTREERSVVSYGQLNATNGEDLDANTTQMVDQRTCHAGQPLCPFHRDRTGTSTTDLNQLEEWSNKFCSDISDLPIPPVRVV